MAEFGIDISQQKSKTLDDLAEVSFDEVITVCAHADSNQPVFTNKPPNLAKMRQMKAPRWVINGAFVIKLKPIF